MQDMFSHGYGFEILAQDSVTLTIQLQQQGVRMYRDQGDGLT